MRILFAGTPDFAARSLAALIAAGHEVALVLTQPDRPTGRGLRTQPSATKVVALQHNLPVFQPQTLKDEATQARLRAVSADIFIVAAYGLILPSAVLAIPPLACLNIHASLLPRWRGAAPIQRAILSGDQQTGISIMQMEAGLDTGPVVLSQAIPITPQDNAGTLHDKLAELGAQLIVRTICEYHILKAIPQSERGITYANKVDKAETRIDWSQPAEIVERHIRAFAPQPGSSTVVGTNSLKIYKASRVEGCALPGTILMASAAGIDVACGVGALRILELQKAGGKRLSAQDFLAGNAFDNKIFH